MSAGEDVEQSFDEIRTLFGASDNEGAISLAAKIAEQAVEPGIVGRALMCQIAGLINLHRVEECPALIDHAFQVVDGTDEHAVVAALHALAGFIVSPSSMERCVRHQVLGWRALRQVDNPGTEAVDAWCNLAVTFSYMGFHTQAMEVAERGYQLGQSLGMASYDFALVEVAVRRALSFDHRGDSATCIRLLREVLETWAQRTSPHDLWCVERCHYAYAALRIAVLGGDIDLDPDLFSHDGSGREFLDLCQLKDACTAIVEGRPDDALSTLDSRVVHPTTLGAPEAYRLRALAHVAAGDYRSAYLADRETLRVVTEAGDDLRNRLVDWMGTQLDHESLRHTVERYASEALTDPLTGLPNRRHLDRYLARIGQRGRCVLGVVDLDEFKTINTVHGHSGGDLVLQRVAAVLARSIRSGDFVARYGGDEFVVLLPGTDLEAARRVGERMIESIADEDWQALVADTPVSITIGWSEMSDGDDSRSALERADMAMLVEKARSDTGERVGRAGGATASSVAR